MANKITRDEIAEKDLFKNIIESADLAISKINELNSSFESLGKDLRESISKIKVDDIKGIKELLTLSKEAEKLAREKIKTDKELIDLTNRKASAQKRLAEIQANIDNKALESQNRILQNQLKNDAKIRESQAKTQEIQNRVRIQNQKEQDRIDKENQRRADRQLREDEKARKQAEELSNAYKKLVISTRELKNESKRLGAEMLELENAGKKNTQEYLDLSVAYKKATREALIGDKALKRLDSQVGDNFRNVGNYRNAVNKLSYALGQMGLAFGVFEGLRYFVDAQIKLNTLQLSLRSISKDAQEFADNFQFVSDVSRKYGQDINNVIDTYKNFIASTNGSNVSLARRKELYEQIIKASSTLALSNDDVQGTLRAVGQIFSKATVQSEELRQQLGERLPNAFGIMAKAIGVSEQELNKMLKDGVLLANDVLPLFGKQIEKQYGTGSYNKLKTLSGAFNLLKTNIVLTIDKAGEGIKTTERFAGAIRFLGENIGTILKVLVSLVTSFGLAKGVIFAIDGSLRRFAVSLLDATKIMLGMKTATEATEASTLRFSKALKSLGWTAIIFAVTELAMKIYDIASGWEKAREEYLNYQKSIKAGEEKANKFLSQKQTELDQIRVQNLVKIRREKDPTKKAELKEQANKELQLKQQEFESQLLDKINKATEKRVKLEKERFEFTKKSRFTNQLLPLRSKEELSSALKSGKEIILDDKSFGGTLKKVFNRESFLDSYSKKENQIFTDQRALDIRKFKEYGNGIANLNKEIITYQAELKKATDLTIEFPDGKASKGKAEKKIRDFKAPLQAIKFEFKDLEEYIVDVNEALKSIDETLNKTNLDTYTKDLEKAVERSNKIANLFFYKDNSVLKQQQGLTGIFNIFKKPFGLGRDESVLPREVFDNYRKQIKKAKSEFDKIIIEQEFDQSLLNIKGALVGVDEYKKIEETLKKIKQLRIDNIEAEAKYKKDKLEEEYKEKSDKEKEFIQKQIEAFDALEKHKLQITYENQLTSIDNQAISESQKAKRKVKVKAEQDKAIQIIDKSYTIWKENNDKIQDANEKKRLQEKNKKIEAINADKEYQISQVTDDIAKQQEDIDKQIVESAKEGLNSMKNTAKGVYDYILLILEAMVVQSERRLEKLNENLDKVKEKQSKLTQLAVNGNIEATQSLALNEKEQVEIQKRIEKEQRRIEMLKLAQSVYSTYASYANNPDIKNPLTKTVTDMTVLSQFVKTLPTFYKGTETDVRTALGNPDLQGKDGYIVRVDGSEKILNPKLSSMTGNMTTYEIAKLAEDHRLGKLIKSGDGAIQINKNYDTELLISKLDSLEKTIKNKAETNVEVGEILGGVMHIVETNKKSNQIVRNIRRYS